MKNIVPVVFLLAWAGIVITEMIVFGHFWTVILLFFVNLKYDVS